jgi:hypothetical protein
VHARPSPIANLGGGGAIQWISTVHSIRQCGSVWQCARLCAAVRAAVCGSVWQCVAVRTAICGSARGSVRQCAWYSVRQCVAVCGSARGSVWQCARQLLCGSAHGSVRAMRAAVCAAVRLVLVYGSVRQCGSLHALPFAHRPEVARPGEPDQHPLPTLEERHVLLRLPVALQLVSPFATASTAAFFAAPTASSAALFDATANSSLCKFLCRLRCLQVGYLCNFPKMQS